MAVAALQQPSTDPVQQETIQELLENLDDLVKDPKGIQKALKKALLQ